MQNRQFLIGTALLLADRWADANAFVAQLQFGDIGRVIAQLYAMQPLNRDLGHLVGDRVASIAREPIDAGAHEKVRPSLPNCAEKLVNVVLTIANMDKSLRGAEQLDGLAHILQPAKAFLFLDRNPRRVDLALECVGALEFRPRSELRGAKAQR